MGYPLNRTCLPYPSNFTQRADVGQRRTTQSLKVVAALKRRYNPTLGMTVGHRDNRAGRPGKVGVFKALAAAADGITPVSVEAG